MNLKFVNVTDDIESLKKLRQNVAMSGKYQRAKTSIRKSLTKKKDINSTNSEFIKNPVFLSDDNLKIFKSLEQDVHEAINGKKIFSVIGGFEVIRQCLLSRGWIEKILDGGNRVKIDEKIISETTESSEIKRIVLSHLLRQCPVYFIWQPKYFDGIPININYPLRNRINRLRTSDFTLKEGLHNLAENVQWHTIEGVSELNYLRSFLLMDIYQRDYFHEEYRRTTITSFINFLNEHENFDSLFSDYGEIPIELVFTCLQRLDVHVKVKQHLCIDLEKLTPNNVAAFAVLTNQINGVICQGKKFRFPTYIFNFSMEKFRTNIRVAAAEIHVYWPESKYDGYRNLWILKPINRSRGIGVVLIKDADRVFEHVLRHNENKYIIQKYCERPLLIYNTKFDIRQYFLTVITRESINIWCYKNCYLKFSSQEFSLDNLHESVHLTNNSIQRFYLNGERDPALPFHNMWLLDEFRSYLKTIGKEGLWEQKIYERIKKNLLAVILASLEDTELEMNTFELNGADFLIGFDFDPILLEINANPDLTYSTPTTRNICPKVMEDLIKGENFLF